MYYLVGGQREILPAAKVRSGPQPIQPENYSVVSFLASTSGRSLRWILGIQGVLNKNEFSVINIFKWT